MSANRVCFWEINAKDGPALVDFYTRLFGWKSEYDAGSDFFSLKTGGDAPDSIKGGIFTGKGRLPTHRCLYVDVEDIDLVCKQARDLGREILQGPFELEGVGALAFLRDPEGHMIGLIQRSQA